MPVSFDPALLDTYVDDGWLTRVDDGPLSIWNYTPKTVFEGRWDAVTLACRGLVLDRATAEVVALPFPKFFNHDEPHAVIPDGAPEVTVKLDGSLGIGFRADGRLRWTTRGSFFSPQAAAAQALWDARYADVPVPEAWTLLVEIIHPVTRNVVRYDEEEMVVLGARDRFTGEDLPYVGVRRWALGAGLAVTEPVEGDLPALLERAEALDDQHEGFVLRWGDHRVKVKSRAYKRVHRLITGLTERALADHWYAGTAAALRPLVSEELRMWIDAQLAELDGAVAAMERAVEALVAANADAPSRKDFVMAVGPKHPLFGMAIRRFLGQRLDYREAVYRARYPGAPRPR
ncbi:MAG: hypothetical protein H6739_37305 [Alphaproteobacteria bacterium]|nr:hypothetical protein [Alphaproteobacteria bacterium]